MLIKDFIKELDPEPTRLVGRNVKDYPYNSHITIREVTTVTETETVIEYFLIATKKYCSVTNLIITEIDFGRTDPAELFVPDNSPFKDLDNLLIIDHAHGLVYSPDFEQCYSWPQTNHYVDSIFTDEYFDLDKLKIFLDKHPLNAIGFNITGVRDIPSCHITNNRSMFLEVQLYPPQDIYQETYESSRIYKDYQLVFRNKMYYSSYLKDHLVDWLGIKCAEAGYLGQTN